MTKRLLLTLMVQSTWKKCLSKKSRLKLRRR